MTTPPRYSEWHVQQQIRALRRTEAAERIEDVDTDTLELAKVYADYRAEMHADDHEAHRLAAEAGAAWIDAELERRRA